ncbi:MAG TPA: neutral/alkaline non-lysosomal ceramidase N-terminal domain-containing protein [Kofleriaceae bacterium]|nr:neutral/alkaline non-lysosomal ceramidase N-terminal domain-containing protein [Kofleriaceae bacterium]
MRGHLAVTIALAAACGNGGHATPDAGVTTDQCTYTPISPTANAGSTVTPGQLQAGAAENVVDVPVGTALGGYTARAGFLGSAGVVDTRKIDISGTFNPSIGIEAAPRVKAVALSAGGETVVIVKSDMIFVYEGMLFDLEQRLGPAFAGKVVLASSHSHSAWAQYTGHGPLKLGAGVFRQTVYNRMLDAFEATAKQALAAMKPAKIGFFYDGNFDPTGYIHHDRRSENDMLPGGMTNDNHFFMIRLDGEDGTPIAAIPIFGEHGTLNSEDNPLASTDAPGALERVMEEQFASPMIVMHLQSAGGDNSPTGHGGLDCTYLPGKTSDPCLPWTTEEGHGRGAVTTMMADYAAAGQNMIDTLPISMLTQSIETGPFPQTFSLRGGTLVYAPFDLDKTPDGVIYEADGATLVSPIDEFDAPVGAGLCESQEPMFPAAEIPGTEGLLPYGSCLRLDVAGSILGPLFHVDFGVDDTHPVCETTRTTISALRLGDYIIGTMPGELTVILANYMRAHSPNDDAHTILVGYSQGHVGYMLEPEDWMMGGYEPSVTFWGPLEAEYIANQTLALMPQAQMATRQDGSTASATRVAVETATDNLAVDDPAPMAGTIPATVPPDTWARTGTPTQAQPPVTIPRVSGIATFTWIGDDPVTKTPHVTLMVESPAGSGTYVPAVRNSGRIVDDAEVLVAYTPEPLQRGSGPQTHVWVAEWQAVPWLGEPNLDSLDDRGGVPLGNYRFHVDGNNWSLDSNPFQVVPGGLGATATRGSGTIAVAPTWFAPKGWRLLDMNLNSNQPVPVRDQAITVTLLGTGGTTLSTSTPTSDDNGNVTVTDDPSAVMAKVTDRFGNTITVTIQ